MIPLAAERRHHTSRPLTEVTVGPGIRGRALWTLLDRLRQTRWKFLPRSGTSLTRAGVYYVVILLVVGTVAVTRQINVMLILAGMLFGPIIYNWRLASAIARSIKVRRLLPSGVCAGDLVVVRVEVTNTASRNAVCAVRLVDRIVRLRPVPGSVEHEVALVVPYLPPGETVTLTYEGRLAKRGHYRLGPLVIVTQFPFGLVERCVTLPLEDELVVCPRLGKLTPRWRAKRRDPFESSHARSQRETRQGEEFFGVREWQRGDSLRWIHWRRSAKHGRWVVRQFECPKNQDLALLVDFISNGQPEEEQEYTIRFAATLLAEMCREGGNTVFFGLAGKESFWIHGPASSSLVRLGLEGLAEAEPAGGESLPGLWMKCAEALRPGGEVLLLSPRGEEAWELVRSTNNKAAGNRTATSVRVLKIPSPEVGELFFDAEAHGLPRPSGEVDR